MTGRKYERIKHYSLNSCMCLLTAVFMVWFAVKRMYIADAIPCNVLSALLEWSCNTKWKRCFNSGRVSQL